MGTPSVRRRAHQSTFRRRRSVDILAAQSHLIQQSLLESRMSRLTHQRFVVELCSDREGEQWLRLEKLAGEQGRELGERR